MKQEKVDTNEGICTGRNRISGIGFDGFYFGFYFYWNLKKGLTNPSPCDIISTTKGKEMKNNVAYR